jgi:hypothetical protein
VNSATEVASLARSLCDVRNHFAKLKSWYPLQIGASNASIASS